MGNGIGSIPHIASGKQTILHDNNMLLILIINELG